MELKKRQPIMHIPYNYSTKNVKELLKKNNFEIRQSGYMYYCNKPEAKEIVFRETFEGRHIFYVDKDYRHTVSQALLLSAEKVS